MELTLYPEEGARSYNRMWIFEDGAITGGGGGAYKKGREGELLSGSLLYFRKQKEL